MSDALYAALLHLYPASFRTEYAGEMRALFRARRRSAVSPAAVIALWLDTISEVIMNAFAAHWDILRQDLTYTIRSLLRAPGFALTAILVTALGIGANTAAFSVADFVLVRPLPYANANELVKVWQHPQSGGRLELSPAIYRDWKASSRSFTALGAFYTSATNLVGQGDPVRLERAVVTTDLLPILGVQPVRGRLFTNVGETENIDAIVLSYALWQGQFAGDERIIGRTILLDGAPRVVVGVMPSDFHFPNRDIALWSLISPEQASDADRTNTYWQSLGRLKPGVTVEQAGAEMKDLSQRLAALYPAEQENIDASVIRLRDEFSSQSRILLLALMGAAACVLLIACANLANLLIARSLTKRRELLVRSALGAGRERLIRQSITESMVLAVLGGSLGLGIAKIAVPLLARLVPTTLPIAQSPVIDPRILIFAAFLTALTGIAFGVLPAWRSAGAVDLSGVRDGARSGGGQRERARSALVITEIMASVVLLISAGLLMRALLRLQDVNPGFKADNVLTLRTSLPTPLYDTTTRRVAFYRDVLAEVRAIPGVTSAAYISGLPMVMTGGIWPVVPEGQTLTAAQAGHASSRFVSPDFFTTLGIPLRDGRDVKDADEASEPYVAVVSESFVKKYWPNESPIGKRFKFLSDVRTVVGVVADIRVRGPEIPSEPQVYLSYKQVRNGQSSFFYPKDLVVKSTVPPSTLVPAIRRIVQRVDPQQPISNIKLLSDVVSDVTAARAVQVTVLGAFACIAFLLAAVGIHGLLSFSVSTRRHEIGVRLALGAQRGDVVRMITRHGVILALAGVGPGMLIAYAAGRAMRSLLAGVQPDDAITFGAAAVLCVVMTVVGTLLPTMRAVKVDPAIALRAEV